MKIGDKEYKQERLALSSEDIVHCVIYNIGELPIKKELFTDKEMT